MAEEKKISIKFPDHLKEGAYANSLGVLFTHEEFVLDFIMAAPPAGTVSARVITTPGHAKRFAAMLNDQIARYERTHGAIKTAMEPRSGNTFDA